MDDSIPDPELRAIDVEMRQQGKSRADLARLLGLDSAQVSRTFAGKRRLQRHEHQAIMQWLGLSDVPSQVGGSAVVPLPGLVPLYGWVGASSASRLTLAEQNLRGYVPAHPNQQHIRDPFALEVADVSMAPRYEPGEIVYLAPNRQPKGGQDCVVVTTEGEGLLKRFVRRSEHEVVLCQLNPERELVIPLDRMAAIHTVVGRG